MRKPFKVRAKIGAIPIVFFASLCTRHWNESPDDVGDYSNVRKRFLTPSDRLSILLDELQKKPPILASKNFSEVWDGINKIAKEKFGKTIIEEIETDIELQKKNIERKEKNIEIPKEVKYAIRDHFNLRVKLFSILKEKPELILQPELYSQLILPKIRPIPITYFPQGTDEKNVNDIGWKGLHKATVNTTRNQSIRICWNAAPQEWNSENVLSLKKIDYWLAIKIYYSPLAKVFLKGRNHRTLIGPEFFVLENELQKIDLKIEYDKEFMYPKNLIQSARSFFNLKGIQKAKCDICHEKVEYPNGFLVSPWFFRINKKVRKSAINFLGGNELGQLRYDMDWSSWLVCTKCKNNYIDPELKK